MSKIGYLGLGAMGGGMARNLLRKDCDVTVFDNRPAVLAEFAELGAGVAGSARELASLVDIVITSLPGVAEVRNVYLGDDGIAAGLRAGSLAIDMSTIPPATSREIADALSKTGGAYIDAPVARTKQAAEAGTLAIMVGGASADFERARPVLELMGTSVRYVGPVGSGNIAKLVNNAVLMANILAVSEGLALGDKLGVDTVELAEVLSEGSANSFALQNHVIGSVLTGEFGEGRFPLTYAIKDITYFLESAESVDLVSPQLSQMATFYLSALGRGFDNEYFPIATTVLDEINHTAIVGAATRRNH
ncbi:NAD(P)-dependent oxidoreductase [Microbacterium sp. A93]|uniref:NAD(P)-dependent oxidoreductase n=1 Tax=Microbacterium sp. A93 TaxID=3450716 RepID=UPI003F43225B